jgi:hypothetical protein
MATTAPIRLRRNGPGLVVMAITGASTGRTIPIMPIATGLSSVDAIAGGVSWRMARLAKMDASVVKGHPPTDATACLTNRGVRLDEHLLIFQAAPQTFDEDVVEKPPLAIHADPNAVGRQFVIRDLPSAGGGRW